MTIDDAVNLLREAKADAIRAATLKDGVVSAYRLGAESMREAVIALAEARAILTCKDDVERAWCRSAQCIVDDVRTLPIPKDKS